jgi:hypothetical protein
VAWDVSVHAEDRMRGAREETMQRQLSMPGVGSSVDLAEPDAPDHDLIERLAQELYVQRGRAPGHALDDWVTAEHLIQDLERQLVVPATRPRAWRWSMALAVLLVGVALVLPHLPVTQPKRAPQLMAEQLALAGSYRALYTRPAIMPLK